MQRSRLVCLLGTAVHCFFGGDAKSTSTSLSTQRLNATEDDLSCFGAHGCNTKSPSSSQSELSMESVSSSSPSSSSFS
uniref:Secreted protein n=1 Tax=Setaria viridis TaxID=4556 RepID=A0A4U6VSU9_SETVI|nr:hypothetical protein SEVIR_2G164999v2 [Setaria viridis]